MTDLMQLTFSGLSIGIVYGLIGVGYVVIFRVSEVLNLAQGDFAALAGLVAIAAVGTGMPLIAAIVAAVAIVVVVAGAVEKLAIAPIKRMNTIVSIILTLGVSTALKAFMLLTWGPEGRGLTPFPGTNVTVFGVRMRSQEFWMIAIGLGLIAAIYWFYDRTTTGKALTACSEQPVAARLVGISLRRASLISFLIAGLVGAVAGVLISPMHFSSWTSGLIIGLKGFVAATLLGNLVSISGALVGGIVLGIVETLVAGYISTALRDAVAFVILILVLVWRPSEGFSQQGTGVRV